MAITNADGSIILTTKIDQTGLNKSLGSIKKAVAAAGKVFLAVGAAAATATVAITKMAVSAYADYEQLIGGVETLFKGSAQKVVDYANDAFYTAGVSASEYMRQVTSFSASLISSTAGDTDKAADVANMALIDISDNANKMGSSMESVTLAYQGFAKQQYMLLDNLKLGYGGTKTEMDRLLKDAQALTGVKYDINNLADVYSAIHAIQEQLGIAGTTAKEAEATISGSANMVKASWENVLSAIAGGGNLDRAINNLVFSLTKFFNNIIPIVEKALVGIGILIEQIAPMLVETVVKSLMRALPSLVVAVFNMIVGVGTGIKEGIKALFSGETKDVQAELVSQMGNVSSSTGEASENMNDLAEATENAGKKAKKFLAPFDELNTKSQEIGENSIEDISTAISGADIGNFGITNNTDYVTEIDKKLADALKVAGAILLVIGIILLGTGNFALGAGFVVAGAGLITVATVSFSGTKTMEDLKKELTKGFVIAGVIAIILGIILCVAGIFPQGIGLIVAGAASLVTAVAINWNAIKEKIDNVLSNEELTKKFLVIGLILLFAPAFWQIAIPLIVLGVAGMVKQEKLDFNKIKEKIKTVFKEIGDWIKTFGALVLGVMLCLTGVGLPIGIALILSGAGHLVDKVSLYWDKYGEKIKEFFNSVLSWVKTWGLLVLGIILIISGVGFPLGLALLYKGAKNLTEAKDPNWFALLDKIKEVWKAIKEYWKANIAKYFTVAWWGNLAKNAINGFLKWIVSGLNKLADKINSFGFNLPDVLGGGRVGFNVPKLSVPQLARGAVLPPNKPFLAMVGDQRNGTNIEAPLDTIVQAFNMALQNNGGSGFNGRIEVPVIIDGRQIALAVREAENNLGSQTVFGGFANAY